MYSFEWYLVLFGLADLEITGNSKIPESCEIDLP